MNIWHGESCAFLFWPQAIHTNRSHVRRGDHEHSRESARRSAGEVSLSLRDLLATSLFAARDGRRTAGAGSNLAPFSSPNFSRSGTPAAHSLVPKPTPANLRRFAETPVARRAINVIKDRMVGMRWRIQPRRGRVLEQ